MIEEAFTLLRSQFEIAGLGLAGYDPAFDQLNRLQDALGNASAYTYDEHGNLTVTTYPDGTTEQPREGARKILAQAE